MKKLSLLLSAIVLSSCAALEGADAKDASDVLAKAHSACAIAQAATADERVRVACGKLDAAGKAAREAAKRVLESVPEVK